MGLLPEQHAARIAFFQNRIANWNSEAGNIGTTTGAVTAVQNAATAAATALAQQQAAQSAAKTATLNLNLAMETLTNAGMIVIEQVRTKARSAGDGVYVLADIPAPAVPSPKPAPAKPADMVVLLQESGELTLTWKCPNPPGTSGTIYQIWRRVSPTAPFTYLGGVGSKRYVDSSLPAGASQVTYQLQAVRSTAVGPWAQFNVNFGVNTAGQLTATVTEGTPVNLAA